VHTTTTLGTRRMTRSSNGSHSVRTAFGHEAAMHRAMLARACNNLP
jgi:hypothetical protein